MIQEMRADAKVLCSNLLGMLQDRQENGQTIGRVWRSKITPREINSMMPEINRIYRWTHGDMSAEFVALRSIKSATKDGYSDITAWTSVGDSSVKTIYEMLEKASA